MGGAMRTWEWAALGIVLTLWIVAIVQVTWDTIQQRRKVKKLYSDWARTKAGRK